MFIITVESFPSMPWRYHYSAKDTSTGKLHVPRYSDAGSDPGEAAARALGFAMGLRNGAHYTIIGPEKVIQHIPPELRHG